MSSTRTAVTLASTAIALLLAGCAGSTGAAAGRGPPATGPNTCELVGDQEAADLVGATVTRTGPEAQNRGLMCTWTADSGLLSAQVDQGSAFYAPDVQAPDARTLTGIADEAFVGDVIAGARSGETVLGEGLDERRVQHRELGRTFQKARRHSPIVTAGTPKA